MGFVYRERHVFPPFLPGDELEFQSHISLPVCLIYLRHSGRHAYCVCAEDAYD